MKCGPAPVSWPTQPDLEWCPPGHGDIYPSLLGGGLLDRMLRKGIKFLFVSNSDNLGATVDLKLLRYFADSGVSFLMEVAARTAADRKGGHLTRCFGAQAPEAGGVSEGKSAPVRGLLFTCPVLFPAHTSGG